MSLAQVLSTLQSQVGTEIHVGEWFTLTQERISQFAEVTDDKQWIHTDPERAKTESPFGVTLAHGYLTLALIPHLTRLNELVEARFPEVKYMVNYGFNRVRFPHPVLVNSKLRARVTLLSVDEVPGGLQFVPQVIIELEGMPKPGCVAEVVARLYF